MSLVGALAWLIITRADTAIYISALQRKLKAPRKRDIENANVVLSYAKREPCRICYRGIKGSLRVSLPSDAAFRAIDSASSGLAMRGYAVLISSASEPSPGGQMSFVDFGCRKQKRVCRSTFAAELTALTDATECGRTVQMALHQIIAGVTSAAVLAFG